MTTVSDRDRTFADDFDKLLADEANADDLPEWMVR
jgi:hypothetical protein